MNKAISYIIIFAALASIFVSHGTKAQTREKVGMLTDEYYYTAISLMYNDSLDESWHLLKLCQLLDSTNAPTYFALAENLSMQNENDQSTAFLEKAYNISPHNDMYALPYADILQQNGNYTKSAEVLEKLIKDNSDNLSYKEKLAVLYLYSGNVKKAIGIYDDLQKTSGDNSQDYERFSVSKMRIYNAVGDEANFIRELEMLSEKYPYNKEYLYSLLGVMVKNKSYKEKANRLIAKLGKNKETEDASLFFKVISDVENKSFESARKGLMDFINMPNVSMAKKAELLEYTTSSLLELSDTTRIKTISLPAFSKLIEENKNNQQLMLQYASTLKKVGDVDYAFNVVKDAIAVDSQNPTAYEVSSRMFLEENDMERCAYISKKATDNGIYKLEYVLWQTAPAFEAENGQDEAIGIILSSLGKHDWLKEDRSILLGVIGDLYSSKKDTTTAISYYEKSLEIFGDNANVANNYAYMLAEMGENLKKAETLGALAVRLQPNNPNNLDTYAWILYKNKSYTLSRIHISKALEYDDKETPSFTINAHASYIYMAVGDREKALEYYNKALEIDRTKPDDSNKPVIENLGKIIKDIE